MIQNQYIYEHGGMQALQQEEREILLRLNEPDLEKHILGEQLQQLHNEQQYEISQHGNIEQQGEDAQDLYIQLQQLPSEQIDIDTEQQMIQELLHRITL